jgi:hypothetical protein
MEARLVIAYSLIALLLIAGILLAKAGLDKRRERRRLWRRPGHDGPTGTRRT